MKAPLLSICIATYNRSDYIAETLDSIIAQMAKDVELLVVDGGSTDSTEEVVTKYTQDESRIRYIRLPFKGGVDHDYDKAVEFANGEFCWLFTDDDLLRPGAIAAVKNAIINGYDLVIVNAEVRNRNLSVIMHERRLSIFENKAYGPNDIEHLFADTLHYISFIGSVVIRRCIWINRERESYFGTEFVHVGVIFQKPISAPTLVIAEPYLTIRLGNSHWAPRSFDIWMFKWPKLVWSFTDISDRAKQVVTPEEPWRNFWNLIAYRSKGSYNVQSYRRYFSLLQINKLWKFGAWIIACFPRSVIVSLNYLYSRRTPESRASFDDRVFHSK